MSPRHQTLMGLLIKGNPATAKELGRELGWGLSAIHLALIRLRDQEHVEIVLRDGVEHYTARKPSFKGAA
uniref:Uncharacterized protein n=1 Tax=viral metagenome TaxID=1070528 RepID=A0A6M3M7Q4_9ZZZZ